MSDSRADDGEEAEDGGEEDGSAATKEIVERIRAPTAKKSGADVGSRVHDTDNPGIGTVVDTSYSTSLGNSVGNIKVIRPRQVSTVGASLISTLYSSANGTEDDGKVKRGWLAPFVEYLIAQRIAFNFIQLGDLLESGRILCHQSTFL